MMTSKMLQVFCLGLFSALVVSVNGQSEIKISARTLKSDLDLILKDPECPPIINIEYAVGAVLTLFVLQNRGGQGQYIQIDGTLYVELPNGYTSKQNNAIYRDGSFGLPNNYDNTAYITIKPDTRKSIKPAHHTIRYISLMQLTEDLREEFKDLQKSKFYSSTMFEWQSFRIGSTTTQMMLIPEDGRILIKKPLKGISLQGEDFSDESCCDMLKVISLDDRGSSGAPSKQSSKQFDVFFDVWYDPKSKLYGSSSGSMGWVDAVRIYEEWSLDISKQEVTRIVVKERRGEGIQKRIFDHDISTAFQLLHTQDGDQTYENVILDYTNEVVLDVRRGGDGRHSYVTATGTTNADIPERKTKNVKAYYDLKKLEYSDQIATNEEFVPENYEQKSFRLRYIDWDTFTSHLKGILAALLGGCKECKTRAYAFSFYDGNIRATYDCRSKTVAMSDTILALTTVSQKAVITKIKNLSYREVYGLESRSLSPHMTPIAIQIQQRQLPFKYSGPVYTNATVFNNELQLLNAVLIKNEKLKKPTLGTIILNDKMLFEIKLPEKKNSPSYVKINGNFALKSESETISHETLNFNEGGFSTSSGVPVKDVFITRRYKPFNHKSLQEYMIASKYLSLNGLILYLRSVLDKAMKRCISRQVKTLSFKLVQHRKFALSGFCDCSQSVMLIEGKFRALLLTKEDGKSEVHTDRFIHDFIYMEKDNFLIPGSGTLDDVYAISVPEMANWDTARKSFGAPVLMDSDTFLVFKSEDE